MIAYRRVYGLESGHLQAECRRAGLAPEPLRSYRTTFTFIKQKKGNFLWSAAEYDCKVQLLNVVLGTLLLFIGS